MPEKTEATPPVEEQSLLLRIVTFPEPIGQLAFDIIKYSDAADYSKMMVGYAILLIIVLIFMGIITPDARQFVYSFSHSLDSIGNKILNR